MILIPSSLHALLSQVTNRQAAPHTAILTSSPLSGGSVISYSCVSPHEIERPFSTPALVVASRNDEEEEEEGHDDQEMRVGCYAALAVGTWNEQRSTTAAVAVAVGEGEGTDQPLLLETEVGRMAVLDVAKGKFLLILVGSQVTPWKVFVKKIRAVQEYLTEPLSKISA